VGWSVSSLFDIIAHSTIYEEGNSGGVKIMEKEKEWQFNRF
jgi:hypothetical protein